jgi:hypothetical protein
MPFRDPSGASDAEVAATLNAAIDASRRGIAALEGEEAYLLRRLDDLGYHRERELSLIAVLAIVVGLGAANICRAVVGHPSLVEVRAEVVTRAPGSTAPRLVRER